MAEVQDDRTVSQLLRQFDQMRKVKTELVKTGQLNGDASVADVIAKMRALLPASMFAAKILFVALFFSATCVAQVCCKNGVCEPSPPVAAALEGGSVPHASSHQRVGFFQRLRHAREERRARRGGGLLFRRFRERHVTRSSERIEMPSSEDFHTPAAPGA